MLIKDEKNSTTFQKHFFFVKRISEYTQKTKTDLILILDLETLPAMLISADLIQSFQKQYHL